MQRNKATKKLSVIDKYGLETNILLRTIFDMSKYFALANNMIFILELDVFVSKLQHTRFCLDQLHFFYPNLKRLGQVCPLID